MHTIRVRGTAEGWPINAITPGDPQHADEILATAMLSALQDLMVLRTDDNKLARKVALDGRTESNVFVYAVGGEYQPGVNWFDYHQRNAPVRPDGIKYSAAGLIWKDLGMDIIQAIMDHRQRKMRPTEAQRREIWQIVDRELVREIDAAANGQATPSGTLTFSTILPMATPVWDEPDILDGAFARACALCQSIFERFVVCAAARVTRPEP